MTFDIPAGFPIHRHVTAKESLENWGPLHVFDANGKQIKGIASVCVSSGEVVIYAYDVDILAKSVGLLEVPIKYPAPLSVRPAK